MKADGNGTDVESEAFRKLFIGGLTSTTTDEILRAFYEQYGELTDCIVMKDPTTQRSRGFGFVTYAKKTQVDAAQTARPHEIDGKKVDSKRAVPKDANDKGPSQVSTQRLYVSGIKDGHTEDMLKDYFSEFGNVLKVDIAKDKNSDTIRGFAFVHFDDYDPVDQCVLMKSHQINDQRCDVKKGLSKEEMAKFDQGQRDRQFRGDRQGGRGGGFGGGGRGGPGEDGETSRRVDSKQAPWLDYGMSKHFSPNLVLSNLVKRFQLDEIPNRAMTRQETKIFSAINQILLNGRSPEIEEIEQLLRHKVEPENVEYLKKD